MFNKNFTGQFFLKIFKKLAITKWAQHMEYYQNLHIFQYPNLANLSLTSLSSGIALDLSLLFLSANFLS